MRQYHKYRIVILRDNLFYKINMNRQMGKEGEWSRSIVPTAVENPKTLRSKTF
jgi:hypothetical protein